MFLMANYTDPNNVPSNASQGNDSCSTPWGSLLTDPSTGAAISQFVSSAIMLLWLTQRQGYPLIRGACLGLMYTCLNLYRGSQGFWNLSGWVLPIYLSSMDIGSNAFTSVTTGGSFVGMIGSGVKMYYLGKYNHLSGPFLIGAALSDCCVMGFALVLLWILLIVESKNKAGRALRTFVRSLTVFTCGIMLLRVFEAFFPYSRPSFYLVGAFIWLTEGRQHFRSEKAAAAGITKPNMFMLPCLNCRGRDRQE